MQANYCPFCLRMVQGPVCPHCGKRTDYAGSPMHLPAGSILNGRRPYMLGASKGQGGFGITYIALDIQSGRRMAVKEFFPAYCAGRDQGTRVEAYTGHEEAFLKGKESFLQEAKMLHGLSDIDSIVNVVEYFEANNTAYLVMEYLDGLSLKDHVATKGRIPTEEFFRLLRPLLEDMARMHDKGVIHRDIAPDNIILLPDGRMKLIDFGAARSFLSDRSMTVIVKKGFAPIEQYMRRGAGAFTDVYALAATIYYCITGIVPVDPTERQYDAVPLKKPSSMGVRMEKSWEVALEKALAIQPGDRTQSVPEFISAIYGADNKTVPMPAPEVEQELRPCLIQKDSPIYVVSVKTVTVPNISGGKVTVKFRNISGTPVSSFGIEVSTRSGNDAWKTVLKTTVDHSSKSLQPSGDSTHSFRTEADISGGVLVSIREVKYSTGALQRFGLDMEKIEAQEKLSDYFSGDKDLLDEYVRRVSSHAKWRPIRGAGYWKCSCGAIDQVTLDTCRICHVERELQFAALDRKELERSVVERKAEEERLRQIELEEKRRKEAEETARNRRIGIIVASVAAVFLLVFGTWCIVMNARYSRAEEMLTAGKYDEANLAFHELNGYKDSLYQANQALYLKAEKLLQNKAYDDSYALFLSLGDHSNSVERAQESMYLKGLDKMDVGRYGEAIEAFGLAGTYQDSSAKIQFCENEIVYQEADALFEAGEYQQAAETFDKIAGHADSLERKWEALYTYGDELMQAQRYKEAYDIFLSVNSYTDGMDRAYEAGYLYAAELVETGELHAAYLMYREVWTYQDARTLGMEAEYTYACACAKDGKHKDAIDAFANIPDYKDVVTRAKESKYQYALTLAAASEWEEASKIFAELKGYRDGTTQYQKTYYQCGLQHVAQKRYTEAVKVFEELGYYSDSKTQLNEAKYQYAVTHKSKTDKITFQYLKDLKALRYKDSADLYETLFAWKVTLIAVNTDPEDNRTIKREINRNSNYLHFRFKLEGGGPGEIIELYPGYTWPNGSVSVASWTWENMEDGSEFWVYWDEGLKGWSLGTFTVRIYSKESYECIYECSVKISGNLG